MSLAPIAAPITLNGVRDGLNDDHIQERGDRHGREKPAAIAR
jgi:hypothetical protein